MTDAGIPMGEGLTFDVPIAFYQWLAGIEKDVRVHDLTPPEIVSLRLAFADTPPPAAAGDRALAEALDRQCDNMAFILNRVELPAQWLAKFERELAEDHTLLKALRTPEPNSGGEVDRG